MNGKEVVMIFPGNAISSHIFPPDLAKSVNDYYREKGVELLAETTVVGIDTRQGKTVLKLRSPQTKSEREIEADGVVAGIGEIDGTARIQRTSGDDVRQRLAGHELEGQEQLALVLADLVERRDVRVRERRRRARFLQEPLAAIGIAGDLGGEHLDRDGAAKPGVASAIDLAHPAGADPIEDFVVPEATRTSNGDDYTDGSLVTVTYLTLLRTNRNFRLLYIGQSDLPARRLVQRRRGLRAAARSHRLGHGRRVDDDRAVPADGDRRAGGRRRRRSRGPPPADDRGRHRCAAC